MKQRSGLDLLEKALGVLREAPARAWTVYLAGSVPFFAALIYFIRSFTGVLEVPNLTWTSFVIAILFGWRQWTRSLFGRMLTEEIRGRKVPGRPINAASRTWFAGMLKLLLLWLPVPYLTALFRNYQACAWEEDKPFQEAAKLVSRGGDAITGTLILAGMCFVIWVNVLTGMILLPTLYQLFTGEDIVTNTAALLNKTVLLSSLAVAWCLCDALFEAFYAVRRFYGEAETSGADIRRGWRKAVTQALVIVGLALTVYAPLQAQQNTPEARQKALNKAIDEVLQQRPYQWRKPLPPDLRQESLVERWIGKLRADLTAFVKKIMRPIRRWWNAFWRWLLHRGDTLDPTGPKAPVDALRTAVVAITVLLAGMLIGLLLRTRAKRAMSLLANGGSSPPPVDLNDPSTIATDLPEEQWIALARDYLQKGDTRLAMRAWFLGSLAFLNGRQLITISRYKSNLDYRRELSRRARAIAGLTSEFTASVKTFEAGWYGLYPIEPADVERFTAGFERMRELCK